MGITRYVALLIDIWLSRSLDMLLDRQINVCWMGKSVFEKIDRYLDGWMNE